MYVNIRIAYLPHQMMYQPQLFLPQYHIQQPEQIIGSSAFIDMNNLPNLSSGILQTSFPINSYVQHLSEETSTTHSDSHSQHTSQVKL